MGRTKPEETTVDQKRVAALGHHVAARILTDAFEDPLAPGARLITSRLGRNEREARALFDWMADFNWNLKVQSGEVVDPNEESGNFEVTEFGRSLVRGVGAVILPVNTWNDLYAIRLSLDHETLAASAVYDLLEVDSEDYAALSISGWDTHRLADLILKNSPVLKRLKELAAAASQIPPRRSGR